MFEAEFLFKRSGVEERAEEMLVAQAEIDGAAHQAVRFFEAAGHLKPAGEPEEIGSVTRPEIFGVAERLRELPR